MVAKDELYGSGKFSVLNMRLKGEVMKRTSCGFRLVLLFIAINAYGHGAMAEGLVESGKVGENALAYLRGANEGQSVVIDITFSAQPYGTPFHRAGLDDDPKELEWVRASILESAGLDERDVKFDASDIGVMSLMIDAAQAQRLAANPFVRSLGVLPEMQGFTAESAGLSNFPYVWNAGYTGSGVKVAVIDNGFSPGHPALPSVSRQYCYARLDTSGYCAGGAVFAQGSGAANYIGLNTGNNSGESSQIHGTSVFATLAQKIVTPTYLEPGLAQNIVPILVNIGGVSSTGAGSSGGYTRHGFLDSLESMRSATSGTNSDVNIINMSFGYTGSIGSPCLAPDNASATAALNALHAEGKALVVAAGNSGDSRTIWPACMSTAITVIGSWNQGLPSDPYCSSNPAVAGGIACWSSYGNDYMDLSAPGSYVTLARSRYNNGVYTHDRIERVGTSFSAPTAAACAALLKQANPSITPEQLRTALRTSPTMAQRPGSSFQRPLLNCAHALANSTAPLIPLSNSGLSGTWYEPRTSGQGLLLNVYPSIGTAWAGWFTYDTVDTGPNGRRWYTLQNATPFNGSATQTTMTIYRTTGSKFDALPASTTVAVGTATLSFNSCQSGKLSYNFNDGRTGVIPLSRLDAPFCNTNPSGDVSYTGLWQRSGLNGQGLFFRIMPSDQKFVGGWFTFTTAGGTTAAGQDWYTLDNGSPGLGRPPGTAWNGTSNSASFGIYATAGGRFNQATPVPTTNLVGSGSIQFNSCTTATLTYSFSDGRSGSIPLNRVGPAPGPC